jgi:hypothetical protein
MYNSLNNVTNTYNSSNYQKRIKKMLLNTFFAQPGTDLDSTWTPPGLLTVQALIWNLPGIYLESMDFTWNPPGVHRNGGGSVKHCPLGSI